jgi:cysteine desulfurase/selenocysteine lyase
MSKIGYDVQEIRKQFPILSRTVNGKPLVYFDNGATTQKPQQVINAIVEYYTSYNSNIHRGVHTLSQEATTRYDEARAYVAQHLNAATANEIIFTRGTTESINFVAWAFEKFVSAGDEVLVSEMEHHSNILPWQQLCQRKKAVLKVIPVNENGQLVESEYEKLLSPQTKIVAITHVSNTLGTINNVKKLVALAHSKNIPVMVDGAQAVPHMAVNVQDIGADFYCFSGHKVYAPTGIGVLYALEKWLNLFDPYQTGGGTIKTVTFEKTEYTDGPHKFEAGTPHIEGAIALAEALKYVDHIGMDHIAQHEHDLLVYATQKLKAIPGLHIIGEAVNKAGVISFVVEGIHPFDLGMLLDAQGIAVRTGHHCTQPLMHHYGINGTVRVSFALYNTTEEVDVLVAGINKALQRLR